MEFQKAYPRECHLFIDQASWFHHNACFPRQRSGFPKGGFLVVLFDFYHAEKTDLEREGITYNIFFDCLKILYINSIIVGFL